ASGATVALIPLLYHTTGLSFPLLLLLVFLGALLDAPGETAGRALRPDLATMAGMPLERANAATQAIQRGARLAGAPLAGILIATFGASTALWVDAATFAVSAAVVALCVPALRTHAGEQGRYRTSSRTAFASSAGTDWCGHW
ncbi:MAG: MFS transporter, partial [Dehalococcoidia bacterium]